jgi:hypothetical protein
MKDAKIVLESACLPSKERFTVSRMVHCRGNSPRIDLCRGAGRERPARFDCSMLGWTWQGTIVSPAGAQPPLVGWRASDVCSVGQRLAASRRVFHLFTGQRPDLPWPRIHRKATKDAKGQVPSRIMYLDGRHIARTRSIAGCLTDHLGCFVESCHR